MSNITHSLSSQSAHLPVRRRGIAAALLVTGLGLGLSSCGKKEEPAKAPPPAPAQESPAPAPKAPPAPAPEPEKPAAPAPPAPTQQPPPASTPDAGPSDADVAQRVSVFKAFHPFYTAGQMLQVPQFSSQLEQMLDAIAKDPALLSRVRSLQPKPGETSTGPVRLNLKLTDYSLPFANRLLAAVLSGAPVRLVNLVSTSPDSAAVVISTAK